MTLQSGSLAKQQVGAYTPPTIRQDEVSDARYVAILVCHGMGQQVQFETLSSLVDSVGQAAADSGARPDKPVECSLVPSEGRFMGRARLSLRDYEGRPVIADFFEAYWAPFTEGKVSLKQTLVFLRDAGFRGLRFALFDGVFDRSMFGKRQEFQIPAQRIVHLGLALWILILTGFAFSALALVPILKLADLLRGVADIPLAFTLAITFSLAASVIVAAVLAALAAVWLRSSRREPDPVTDQPQGFLKPSALWRWGMLAVVLGVIVLNGWITLRLGLWMYGSWLVPAVSNPGRNMPGAILAALAFLAEIYAFKLFIQRFLVQFVGDVAAYISPFKVSAFEEIRHAIQDRAKTVARFIYQSQQPHYDDVFFVGHSLGSVIAYDAVNDSMNRDLVAGSWGAGVESLGVIQRTRLLLTFGSPLDKTAFIFRTQKTNSEVDIRDIMTSLLQPLIVKYENRAQCRWINLWSPSDWISGRLSYYDAPAPPAGLCVSNIRSKGGLTPWKAHTRYWDDDLLPGVLFSALTWRRARKLSASQQDVVFEGLQIPVA